MLLRMRIDLLSAARHRVYKIIWNIADFEHSPSRVELDLVAKFAQVVGEFVATDLSRSHLLGEHGAGFEARPLLVAGMPSHVEDHDVGMEMRVEFARGMFSEARIEQLACRFMPNIDVHTSAKPGMPFRPAEHTSQL